MTKRVSYGDSVKALAGYRWKELLLNNSPPSSLISRSLLLNRYGYTNGYVNTWKIHNAPKTSATTIQNTR